MSVTTFVQSKSYVEGASAPSNQIDIGSFGGAQELVIFDGRITVYNEDGQVTIQDGVVQARGITANSITAEKLTVSNRGYIHNIPFTSNSKQKIDWGSGTIHFSGGESVEIKPGTTGLMSQPVFIYSNATNELKITPSEAVALASGHTPIAIGIPSNHDDEKARILDYRGKGTTISGDQIVTGKVSADRIWVGIQNFVTDVVFSPTGPDQLQWSDGNLKFADGLSRPIDGGGSGRVNLRTSQLGVDANTFALLRFDETSGTALDNSENDPNWDATATGTTAIAEGRFGYCRLFDGVDDVAVINHNAEMDMTKYTYEVSIKTDAQDKEMVVFSRANTVGNKWPVKLFINTLGRLVYQVRINTALTYTLTSQESVNDGEWHDIIISFDDVDNTMKMWIDNSLHGTLEGAVSDPPATTEPFTFGRTNEGGGTNYFEGYIDEFRVSNIVREPSSGATKYIYWDNEPNLKVTDNREEAVGNERVLLAIMTPKLKYSKCEVQVFGNDGTIIDGDKIQTGRVSSADGRTYFDLNERRIVMNDGANDRIILGFHPTRFIK